VFKSPLADVEIPDTPLTSHVFRDVSLHPDRVAVVDGLTGASYTYGRLHDSVRAVAGGLVAEGLAKGDVFAILAPNLPEYAIAFHGVAHAGGIVTTINPTYTVGEIGAQLRDSAARMLLTIPSLVESAVAAGEASGVEEVFVFGEAEGARSFSELAAAGLLVAGVPIDPAEDVVVVPYSSGTTGLPKGVRLTHRNLVANLVQYESISSVSENDVILAVLPFFHIYGMQVLMNGVLSCGATTVTMPRFDLTEFLRIIEQHAVTRVAAVPPIVLALAKSPLVDKYDLSSLQQIGSGAAPLSGDVEREASWRTGATVVQGFGLTETSPVTHAMPAGETRSGSIGVPVPNTEVRVVDPESGESRGVGEDGEIWIRGPQVMKGYLNNPAATAATIDEDGWLRTGDIGRVDEDGYWYVTDRLKELIKYKGFQVAPAELEAVLLTHSAIADAAVIPIPDEEAGEVPKAFVVLQPERTATVQEIIDYVGRKVAAYKRIREVEVIDTIPKSPSGKILRRELRDRELAASQ